MNRRMIKAYFGQGVQYFSESKGEFVAIAAMHPKHAANAARRILAESDFWAKEAGMTDLRGSDTELWLMAQPLMYALACRGMGLA